MNLRGFRFRIVLLMIAVVLVAQLTTFAVVQFATARAVTSDLQGDIELGQRVWSRMNRRYGLQLLENTRVLASDFGFKAAATSGDSATMESALLNHGQRVSASVAILLAPDGHWLAGTLPLPQQQQDSVIGPLLARARRDGSALDVVVLQGRLYRIAMAPVQAPEIVGWVVIGERMGNPLANDFRSLTGLGIAFVRESDRPVIYGSSLDVPTQVLSAALPRVLSEQRGTEPMKLSDTEYLSNGEVLLDGSAHPELRAVVFGSLDQALEPFVLLKQQILVLSALAGLAAVAVAALLARTVSRPVEQLVVAARRMQAGDYTQGPQISAGGEIGELAESFGRMQQEIGAREGRLLHQAFHDALTGLPNRASARRWVVEALAKPMPAGCYGVLMLLNLDRFKEINSAAGYEFADTVLVEIGRRLSASAGEGNYVARMGGDEFMVVFSEVERETGLALAQQLLNQLRQPVELPAAAINIDAGIGLAVFPDDGTDPITLIRRADIALQEAKGGHAGVSAYQAGRDEQHQRKLRLMGDLRTAASRGEFYLRFQPKVSLSTNTVEHVEALLRWQHSKLGQIFPDEFIALAEHSGAIHEVTRYVLDEALACNARWRSLGLDLGIAINLSVLNLMDAQLPDSVERSLQRHGVPPHRVILEVTESAVMGDVEYAIRMLQQLRDCGVRLSIDDFGTGYSSLAQLKRMPVDELKIDKSFVMQLAEGSDDEVIVRSTIELGHNMGLSVIAEGVESESIVALLRQYHCDMAQGYHYAKPLLEAELLAWCDGRQCRMMPGHVLHEARP
ncbi:diguanylate cyclase/phosphodiesterase [Pseudoxanthomonas sp. GM95]|uniref:putative bifunctional diguanylate cyclase/phosphodiesterase n=1 Tax=Pseudoxanthomonas sp. GM95 TaxID=1881043 RepID=UPI0008CAE2DB|nr:EAL domain-containing protein [Pseudoxanthomonas sp. GM95]SEK89371.1 diguanylate cyclase/phosphodiesterase [Pseudoxanthomonas sp. GM95]